MKYKMELLLMMTTLQLVAVVLQSLMLTFRTLMSNLLFLGDGVPGLEQDTPAPVDGAPPVTVDVLCFSRILVA